MRYWLRLGVSVKGREPTGTARPKISLSLRGRSLFLRIVTLGPWTPRPPSNLSNMEPAMCLCIQICQYRRLKKNKRGIYRAEAKTMHQHVEPDGRISD